MTNLDRSVPLSFCTVFLLFCVGSFGFSLDRNDYYSQWGTLSKAGEFAKAIDLFEKAIGEYPQEAGFQEILAYCYQQVGKPDKALPHYDAAYRLDPMNKQIRDNTYFGYIAYGWYLGTTHGDWASTVQWVIKAEQISPENPSAYSIQGMALCNAGKTEDSISAYETASSHDPTRAILPRDGNFRAGIEVGIQRATQLLDKSYLIRYCRLALRFYPKEDSISEKVFAALWGNPDSVFMDEVVKAGARVDEVDGRGQTPLIWAARNWRPEAIVFLLEAGAGPNPKSAENKSALEYALANRESTGSYALEALSKSTRGPTYVAHFQESLGLLYLARVGTAAQVQSAMGDGADVNEREGGGEGLTPLIVAARYNSSPEVIAALLKAGAKVDDYDSHEKTALMWAAQGNSNPEVTLALLKAGGALEQEDSSCRTPLILASGWNHNANVVAALLRAGAMVGHHDKTGMTPLMFAARYNSTPQVVRVLLMAGAKVDESDSHGMTALMWAAARNESASVVAALLGAGARVDRTDESGLTPLMWAALQSPSPDIVEELLRAGADRSLRSKQGMTAKDYAGGNALLKWTNAYLLLDQRAEGSVAKPRQELQTLLDQDSIVQAGIGELNRIRRAAGLAPVRSNPDAVRSSGCALHARYLVLNEGSPALEGLKAHGEDPALEGHTATGAEEGLASVIAWAHSVPASIDGWIGSFYHRIPLLEPDLLSVGIGYARTLSGIWICLIDYTIRSGTSNVDYVSYPGCNQSGVPCEFYFGEVPNPLPRNQEGAAGFPVTVTFTRGQKVENASLTLQDSNHQAVDGYYSDPEHPIPSSDIADFGARVLYQYNTVCFIPAHSLKAATCYTANLSATADGKSIDAEWSFTTAK